MSAYLGVDVLIFYTDGAAPRYQPVNVRYELISRRDIANRIKDAFEYASGKPQKGMKYSL
jgi:hypothetical protein